jgi:formylglycine-generating enzyme required for sulfatase activity
VPVHYVNWSEAAGYCNKLSTQNGFGQCYDCVGAQAGLTCATKVNYGGSAIYACPGYRLPTEAEWEYAYRAGTTTAYHSGSNTSNCSQCEADVAKRDQNLEMIAWSCEYGGYKIQHVAQKQPNGWGLYDMAGNVYNWVHDWYGAYPTGKVTDPAGPSGGTFRVTRGGAWNDQPEWQRAAYRGHPQCSYRGHTTGFRCVRTK